MGESYYYLSADTTAAGTWTTWTTTSTATVDANVWTQWATTAGGTNTTVTGASTNAWQVWTTGGATGSLVITPYVDQRTPEQRAADEARFAAEREEVARRAAAREAERKAARDRARALLLSMLSVQQRESLEREQFFEIVGRHTRRRYRIRQGTHGNVRLLYDHGREVASYCAQPHGVPDEDAMLAQKLMIEHEEESFLKVANKRQLVA